MAAQRKIQSAEETQLAARLKERIAREGPISVHDYMQACLADRDAGYYVTRRPIGKDGDFVTAPEISQVFGELLGVWAAAVWQTMGEPAVVVAELGPGRGTLMQDALRVFGRVPGLLDRIRIALIETSPVLRETQRATLSASPASLQWCESIQDLPQGPLILIANEFIDALPVRQFLHESGAWRERSVTLDATGAFAFCGGAAAKPDAMPQSLRDTDVDDGAIIETRPAISSLISALAARAKAAPIAALFADYGHAESGSGDTLQAVQRHRFADPLAAPGEADLTAHVDFAALKQAACALGLAAYGPMPQGEFLLELGLEARCERLLQNAAPEQRAAILSGAARLADPRQMGLLFKMLALQSSGLAPPPPFGDI
ncbi:MAG: class I SAM-dependent methyltransferase [Methyloceanibacter sp.]